MFCLILTILLVLTFTFPPATFGATLPEDICSRRSEYDSQMELSGYESVRGVLSATDFVDGFGFKPTSTAAKIAKAAIYAEDFFHTSSEVKGRTEDILSSPFLANASDYPELYVEFKKYLKKSLDNWVPDRDFPRIGYLPKELLSSQCLGEKEITKYWPEASLHDQRKYVALTLEDLALNYKIAWNNLCQNGRLTG